MKNNMRIFRPYLVIDPDPATGEFVKDLVGGHDIEVQSHRTARAFFSVYEDNCPGCIVLETRLVDASGFQIQRRCRAEPCLPMVFVTSTIDVSTAVALMRDGAVHVMEKPLRGVELLDAIQEALSTRCPTAPSSLASSPLSRIDRSAHI